MTKLNHANLDVPTQEHEVLCIAERLARNHPALRRFEVTYGTYWTGVYRARWDRSRYGSGNGNRGREWEPGGEGESPMGVLDFEESKRHTVFQNINRMSEEEWEEVRERKRRFGHVFLWFRKMLARR
jgi:hypothetical protein